MKGLHAIGPNIDPIFLAAAARLLQSFPSMRFRLTGVPYDYAHDRDGVPIEYFHVGRWMSWTSESIHDWARDSTLGTGPLTADDIEAARERFEPR